MVLFEQDLLNAESKASFASTAVIDLLADTLASVLSLKVVGREWTRKKPRSFKKYSFDSSVSSHQLEMFRTNVRSLIRPALGRRAYSVNPSPPSSSSHPTSSPSSNPPSVPPPRPQKHSKAKKQKQNTASAVPLNQLFPKASPSASRPSLRQLLPQLQSQSTDRRWGPSEGKAIALTTAESYDTRVLLQGLEQMGLLGNAVNLLGEAILLPRWSPPTPTTTTGDVEVGEVFIFESGTIVLWGLSMRAAEQFLRTVIRGSTDSTTDEFIGWVEQGRYEEPETEVLEYWVGKG